MKALLLASLALTGCLADTHFTVGSEVIGDEPRLGLNLGSWTSWGDEQLMSNVLKNPGFEALQDRSLVSVDKVAGDTFFDRHPDSGRRDDVWQQASLTVLNRDARPATVAGNTHADGRYQLAGSAALYPGDVVRLEKSQPVAASMWWPRGEVSNVPQSRPGSPGRQAVQLATNASLYYWLDTESGDSLPVNGEWQLRFWLRAPAGPARLKVRFARQGEAAMLAQELNAGPAWQAVTLPFNGHQAAKKGALELSLQAVDGSVQLDDAWLGASAERGAFRQTVIDTLKALRPGVLRDWQGQLGDSAANRLAAPWARHPVRYREGEGESLFLYGIPEFIELARSLGSQPWIILPTTLDDGETRALGQWLQQHAQGMTVWVEFGNENWNPLFQPAGLTDAASHVQLAARRFSQLQQHAKGLTLRPVINGQFYNPEQAVGQLAGLPAGVSLAVGPYFAYQPTPGLSVDEWSSAALDDGEVLRERLQQAQGDTPHRIAAYELNFHSTQSQAEPQELAALVNSPRSGFILGWQLMRNQQAGISPQLIYTLSGRQTRSAGRDVSLPLWGISENLASGRLRPSGLAMRLLNQAWGGPQLASHCQQDCDTLQLLAFGKPDAPRLIVANRGADKQITIALPASSQTYRLQWLDGRDSTAGQAANLIEQNLSAKDHQLGLHLPAYSLAILMPQGEPS